MGKFMLCKLFLRTHILCILSPFKKKGKSKKTSMVKIALKNHQKKYVPEVSGGFPFGF